MFSTRFICVAGKNSIAVDVLEYLLSNYRNDFRIGVVCNRTETGKNGFSKSLRWFSRLWGVKEYRLEELYDVEGLLLLSMEFDRIIIPEKFKNARLFNIHFSKLPFYRGVYTSAWPILNGEIESGVTFHEIDSGIDTGDIVDQKVFPISGMSCRELYFEYLRQGTDLVLKNLDKVIRGLETKRPQPMGGGSYYSKGSINFKNFELDFFQQADLVNKTIKACTFREYQLLHFSDRLIVESSILRTKSLGEPGEVVMDLGTCCIVKTLDFDIALYFDRLDELCEACKNNDISKVKDICSSKAHINAAESAHGWTPLMISTYYNNAELSYWLVSNGADVFAVNYNGTNMLMYAKEAYKKTGDDTLFKFYRTLGLKLDSIDYFGKSVLDYILEDNDNSLNCLIGDQVGGGNEHI